VAWKAGKPKTEFQECKIVQYDRLAEKKEILKRKRRNYENI
jgi:hypothetical protein